MVSNSQPPSSPATKSIVVLDPAPQIGAITVSPASPLVCQPVTITATGVTGQPTLGYSWTLNGTPVARRHDVDLQLGDDRPAERSLHGGCHGDQRRRDGHEERLDQPRRAAAARLHRRERCSDQRRVHRRNGQVSRHGQGATEWSWDFGDGQGFRGWTSDPVNGPNPTFSYTATGAKAV